MKNCFLVGFWCVLMFLLAGCAGWRVYTIPDVEPGTNTAKANFAVGDGFYDGVPPKRKVPSICLRATGGVYETRTGVPRVLIPHYCCVEVSSSQKVSGKRKEVDWRALWKRMLIETERDIHPAVVDDWGDCPKGAEKYEAMFRWTFSHGLLGVLGTGSPYMLCSLRSRLCYAGTVSWSSRSKRAGRYSEFLHVQSGLNKVTLKAVRAMYVVSLYVRYHLLTDLGLPVEDRLVKFVSADRHRYVDHFIWDWFGCPIRTACPGDPYKKHHGLPFSKGNFWYGAKILSLERGNGGKLYYRVREKGKRVAAFE